MIVGGVVVIDVQGNLMMVVLGVLFEGMVVLIKFCSVDDFGMLLLVVDIMNVIGVVDIDFGGQKFLLLLQFVVKLVLQIDFVIGQLVVLVVGIEVFFWCKGMIVDGQGVIYDIWWLVDNGVVGVDGFVCIFSLLFDGVGSVGMLVVIMCKVIDSKMGVVQVIGVFINFNVIWLEMVFVVMVLSLMMVIEVMGIFVFMLYVLVIKYMFDGMYQFDVFVMVLMLEIIFLQFLVELSGLEYMLDIMGLSFDLMMCKFMIFGSNFLLLGSFFSNYQFKVWLELCGDQMEDVIGYGVCFDCGLIWQVFSLLIKFDGLLEIMLDFGIVLLQYIVYVECVVLVLDGNGVVEVGDLIDSMFVEVWQEVVYMNFLVLLVDVINIFVDGLDKIILGLVKKLIVDE